MNFRNSCSSVGLGFGTSVDSNVSLFEQETRRIKSKERDPGSPYKGLKRLFGIQGLRNYNFRRSRKKKFPL